MDEGFGDLFFEESDELLGGDGDAAEFEGFCGRGYCDEFGQKLAMVGDLDEIVGRFL